MGSKVPCSGKGGGRGVFAFDLEEFFLNPKGKWTLPEMRLWGVCVFCSSIFVSDHSLVWPLLLRLYLNASRRWELLANECVAPE